MLPTLEQPRSRSLSATSGFGLVYFGRGDRTPIELFRRCASQMGHGIDSSVLKLLQSFTQGASSIE